MEIGYIKPQEITKEMQDAYLDYAMSVIVGRALPDVRDGLKPVHRRILYTMWDMGLRSAAKLRKSATVVGECFVKDTLIATSEGLLPIQKIKIGDKVFTQSGQKEVIRLYVMPPRELLNVTLENGLSSIVTASQKFKILTPDWQFVWKEAKDLSEDDYLVIRNIYPNINKHLSFGRIGNRRVVLNENLAYLTGLIISEGWISNDYSKKKYPRIGIAVKNKKILERVKNILVVELGYAPEIKIKEELGFPLFTIRINSKIVNSLLIKFLDLENKKALTKDIPEKILRSPAAVVDSFLSGLIEGDGHISVRRNLIQYGSISQKLIDQLMILLLSRGIFASKYVRKKSRGGMICGKEVQGRQKFFSLEITGSSAIRFARLISLSDDVKESKAHRLREEQNRNWSRFESIPFAGQFLFGELKQAHLGGGWYQQKDGMKFRAGIKYLSGTKIRYSHGLCQKPLKTTQILDWGIKDKLEKIGSPFLPFINSVIENNLCFFKVASVLRHPAEITYDIEVRDDHEFLANGIVSHNCLGKYHPHGDMAVYDSMVRLAQDFSMRYPLVQGQGNFGSLDGDAAAAMRYTESRLTPLAEEMMQDIDKETVNWVDNYDGTRQEPTVLPAKLPQLLLNGSVGIAVGMATNIPSHNLSELIDGIIFLIENPKSTTEDLMKFIKGPDFPTGGAIYDRQAIVQTYSTGKGAIVNRATAEIVEDKKGARQIIISEIPFQVNKAVLLETIAELIKEKKIEGIRDIRDESDKDGVRIAVDLKPDSYPQKVLNRLYKLTDLQKTFHLNMLALVEGLQPQVLSLKGVLEQYVEHRYHVITRRTQFDLARAKERAHILEGLKKALDHIDAVISTIKKSATREEAHEALCQKFRFSEAQASAILEMKLQTLAGLERQKINEELKEKIKLIAELEALLKSPKKILEVIKKELAYLKEKFGDERRTKVFASPVGEFKEEDLVPEEECIITLTRGGYIKRMNPKNYRAQNRGGKGVSGITTREEDAVKYLECVNTHDNLLFFTSTGRVFQTKAYEIPEASRVARGAAIVNFLELRPKEEVNALVALKENLKNRKKVGKIANSVNGGENYLVMMTKNGIIKKTPIEDFINVRRSGLLAIKLAKGDELRWVKVSSGTDEIILVTLLGQSIRFKEKDARPMGRAAAGVRGIRLKRNDEVIAMESIKAKDAVQKELLVVAENGYGKKTNLKQFKIQRRGGSGVKAGQVTQKTGRIVGAKIINPDEEDLIVISAKGQVIRTALGSISLLGRATQGVRIMKLEPGDKIASITCL